MKALSRVALCALVLSAAAGCAATTESQQACQEEKAKLQTMLLEQERVINDMRLQVEAADRRVSEAFRERSVTEQRAADQVAAARQAVARLENQPSPEMFVNRRFSSKLQQQLEDLVQRFGGQLVGNRLVMDSDLYFASGNYTLNNHAKEALRQLANILRNERLVLLIVGHTDSDPVRNPNLRSKGITDNRMLSMWRAKSVLDELKTNHYPDNLMYATGWGDLLPVDNSNSREGKRLNRRVEILIDTTASNIFGISEIQSITAMN